MAIQHDTYPNCLTGLFLIIQYFRRDENRENTATRKRTRTSSISQPLYYRVLSDNKKKTGYFSVPETPCDSCTEPACFLQSMCVFPNLCDFVDLNKLLFIQ